MTYAYHLPTRRFAQADYLAMPLMERIGGFLPEGFSRYLDPAGKAIVVFSYGTQTHAVRPIVVVKAVCK